MTPMLDASTRAPATSTAAPTTRAFRQNPYLAEPGAGG